MAIYKIEKKIPMPAVGIRNGTRYPFADMEVSDSFFVPAVDVASIKSLRASAYAANRRMKGKQFRVFVDSEDKGFRVFRAK